MPISTNKVKIGTAIGLFEKRKVVVSDNDLGLKLEVDRSFLAYRINLRLMPYILFHLQIRRIAGDTQIA